MVNKIFFFPNLGDNYRRRSRSRSYNRLLSYMRLGDKFFKLKYDPYFQPIPVMQENFGICFYFSYYSSLKRAAHTLDRALRTPGTLGFRGLSSGIFAQSILI